MQIYRVSSYRNNTYSLLLLRLTCHLLREKVGILHVYKNPYIHFTGKLYPGPSKTVNLAKNPEFRQSGDYISQKLLCKCKFLKHSEILLFLDLFGSSLAGPRLDVSLCIIIRLQKHDKNLGKGDNVEPLILQVESLTLVMEYFKRHYKYGVNKEMPSS